MASGYVAVNIFIRRLFMTENNVIYSDRFVGMARGGRELARNKKLVAAFEYNGAQIKIAACEQGELARKISAVNLGGVADSIGELSRKMKRKNITEKEKTKIIEELKNLAKTPFAHHEEASAQVLAEYIIDIDSVANKARSDGKKSFITLGWIIKLGIILADYEPSMADIKVEFNQDVAAQLLAGSRTFSNWLLERLTDMEAFYAARLEAEKTNLKKSPAGSRKTNSKVARLAGKRSLK